MSKEANDNSRIKTDAQLRESLQSFLNLFKPPSGAIYQVTGKASPQDMTPADYDKVIADGYKDAPEAILSTLNHDKPELTNAILPRGMSAAEFQHFFLLKLAQQNRGTDLFRFHYEDTTIPEQKSAFKINGEELQLKPSERQAFALHVSLLTPADKIGELNEELRRVRSENINVPDVSALAAGYIVGAIPTFNRNINPSIQNPLAVQANVQVNAPISQEDIAKLPPAEKAAVEAQLQAAYAEAIQQMYCDNINKPFASGARELDTATAYRLGFMQARTDAKRGFETTSTLGITEPCPPLATPTSGIANGNGTSSVNPQGGGGPVASPSAKGR